MNETRRNTGATRSGRWRGWLVVPLLATLSLLLAGPVAAAPAGVTAKEKDKARPEGAR